MSAPRGGPTAPAWSGTAATRCDRRPDDGAPAVTTALRRPAAGGALMEPSGRNRWQPVAKC
jgi:hypothetical protein